METEDKFDDTAVDHPRPRVSDACSLVLAKSTTPTSMTNHYLDASSSSSSSSWSVFSMVDRPKGSRIHHGDVVIQWVDPIVDDPNNHQLLEMAWPGYETGGQFEADHVRSVMPGLGMLVQRRHTESSNILPFAPQVDEGGLTRMENAGAGAITHYHNFTWYAHKDIRAGDELFQRTTTTGMAMPTTSSSDTDKPKPSLEWLRRNGYCLDNIMPKTSRIKEAGRGAFATRDISQGSIVAPVPVVQLSRASIAMNDHDTSKRQHQQQPEQQKQKQKQKQKTKTAIVT